MIKIISWNVNGIRAVLKKGFLEWFGKESPDVLCVQEIKAQESQIPFEILRFLDYEAHWNPAVRAGYSGVATFSRVKPLAVKRGLEVSKFDLEGRVLETEFKDFTLLNIYFPNGGMILVLIPFALNFFIISVTDAAFVCSRSATALVVTVPPSSCKW